MRRKNSKNIKKKKPKKKQEFPIMALDTEDNSKGKVYILNFFDGVKHYTFKKDTSKAVDFLYRWTEKHGMKGLLIWSTNLEYDLNNLFKNDFGVCQRNYVGGRVISARLSGTNIRFYDTLNHWKMSVKAMGERIGLRKLDAGNYFNNVRYCRRDTEITFRFVERMLGYYQEIDAKPKSTIGATALHYFKEKYHKKNWTALHRKEIEFIRQSCRGGRVEIFWHKPIWGDIHYGDVNSLYPWAMQFPLPQLDLRTWTKNPRFEKEGVVDVTVESPDLNIPYLATKHEDKLVFPKGVFRDRYTYYEIREALKIGYKIKKVHRALEFFQEPQCFLKEFVDDLYSKRKIAIDSGDKLLSDTYKLLLNNLFGKFNQGNERTLVLPFKDINQLKHGDVYDEKNPSFILRNQKTSYPDFANIIWSSYITARARDRLYRFLLRADEFGKLIYCDTDSIIWQGHRDLFNYSTDLGELKYEGNFCYAHFLLPKLYKLLDKKKENHYKTKGVPKAFQSEYFENRFVFFEKPNRFKESFRAALRMGGEEHILGLVNVWETQLKTIGADYTKRRKIKGGQTRPIILQEQN